MLLYKYQNPSLFFFLKFRFNIFEFTTNILNDRIRKKRQYNYNESSKFNFNCFYFLSVRICDLVIACADGLFQESEENAKTAQEYQGGGQENRPESEPFTNITQSDCTQ